MNSILPESMLEIFKFGGWLAKKSLSMCFTVLTYIAHVPSTVADKEPPYQGAESYRTQSQVTFLLRNINLCTAPVPLHFEQWH